MSDVILLLQRAGFETFVTADSRQLRRVTGDFPDSGHHELVAVRSVADFGARTGWRVAP
jgi:hypothetical protein